MASGSFFEGMSTPIGLVAGCGSFATIALPFFPMFTSLRQIFPPPLDWGAWQAATLATFVCLAIKTYMHTFREDHDINSSIVGSCGGCWVGALMVHLHLLSPSRVSTPNDQIASILFYLALFGLPAYAFSAMQIHAARQGRK